MSFNHSAKTSLSMHVSNVVFKTFIQKIILSIAAFAVLSTVFATDTPTTAPKMTKSQAIILGIVEGVTEYLPVSSTGHLLLASRILGIGTNEEDKKAADAYSICIQLGAILSVLLLYAGRFKSMVLGVFGKDQTGLHMAIAIIVAFIPAAAIGFLSEDFIKAHLFGMWPVAGAWFFGGLVILAVAKKTMRKSGNGLDLLSIKGALVIGIIQCMAMWPGVSRSLATILGGLLVGLSAGAAVEFSFLLGFVTLSAATAWDALKYGKDIVAVYGVVNPLIGLAAAFISATIAIRWMVGWLSKRGLGIFGWYRIALAIAVGAWLYTHGGI
jgi:undecaprenyl-diphosphatase